MRQRVQGQTNELDPKNETKPHQVAKRTKNAREASHGTSDSDRNNEIAYWNAKIMHIPQASGKRSKAPPGGEMKTNHAGERPHQTWMGVGVGREGGRARGREMSMNDMRWKIAESKESTD